MRISVALSVEVPDQAKLKDVADALMLAKQLLGDVAKKVEQKLPKNSRARARRARLEG